MTKEKILVTGAFGQLGSELVPSLQAIYGKYQVIATDIRLPDQEDRDLPVEKLDVTNAQDLGTLVDRHQITQIYHLAAILSAKGEQNPLLAWQINMQGTLNVLEVAREKKLHKIYFPSSIAAFGTHTPRYCTPQHTIMDPNTVYGISKLAGERWGEYYFEKYGLDVRSLRYPGIISYKTPPGGGTTDYAVEIFYKALEGQAYRCFLKPDTYLPMVYMPDAIQGTLTLMEAETHKIRVRSSYNLGAMSFSPKEIHEEICQHFPDFEISYEPDFRQGIADSWPASLDDGDAHLDWGWQPVYDLKKMTADMIQQLGKKLKAQVGSLHEVEQA